MRCDAGRGWRLLAVLAAGVAAALANGSSCIAQSLPNPMLTDKAVKISDHVWAIMGFPNIGIVIGSRGVLVVDTGLGPRNGAVVAKVIRKLAPGRKIYLTTTHFHPEHAAGESGLPAGTILIRNAVQQQELEAHGQEMIEFFAQRSLQNEQLLAGVQLRKPDVLFDTEYQLILGDSVKVRLLWWGMAHTKGDELIFVSPDKTLIAGDVVQNRTVPNIFREGGTPASWIALLDRVQTLGALRVLPDHSPVGTGALVAQDRAFIANLRTRALSLKSSGLSADDAGARLSAEFKREYPDWHIGSVSGFVKSAYAE